MGLTNDGLVRVDTYWASSNATNTPAATPTDIIQIRGSATKTVKVLAFVINATATAAGHSLFFLTKRSTANTTGTFVAQTAVPVDSVNAAATAVIGHYTVNAGGLGTVVGQRMGRFIYYGITAGTTTTLPAAVDIVNPAMNTGSQLDLSEFFTLRGIAESLSFDRNAVALPAGFVINNYTIVWTEE